MPALKKLSSRFLFRALENVEPAPMAGFTIPKQLSATIVPQKYVTYKPPRIVKTAKRWYVEYWYRVPPELKDKYSKEYERFRVFEDINRYKTDEYARLLRDAVELGLSNGYNPFKRDLEDIAPQDVSKDWSLSFGLDQFLIACREKKLRRKTIESYTSTINILKDRFSGDNRIFKSLSFFTKKDFKEMLLKYKRLNKWEANTYNGYVSNLGIIFNWFVKEERLERSPVFGIEPLKASVNRHRYYDEATAAKLKEMISKANPYLYSFIEFIYYTAIRPKSEARFLQIKHLYFDRKLIHIPGNIAKNDRGDYVPMDESLLANLSHLQGMDPDLYIWGTHGPAKRPTGQNYFASLYKPFKDKLGLGPEFSIYGYKHLRAIHLAQAGASPYDIMRLFRHSSLEQTQIYMKDLGLTDFSEVLKKGKRF